MCFQPASGLKISRIAFKQMGLIGGDPVNIPRGKVADEITCKKSSRSLQDEGELDLRVQVQVIIEIWKVILLGVHGAIFYDRNFKY